ncbi:MAG: flap endonuclease-1 [Candidatus Aenigmatarchaeota archaeon]
MGVQLGESLKGMSIEPESLNSRIIAIDAFNWLYQFLSSIRQYDGTPLKDLKGRITSHLSGLFYRTAKLIEYGIRPVYVFDGEQPKFKVEAIKKRREAKDIAREKWEEALERGDIVEAKKQAQRTAELTDEMIRESKELLDGMGVPIVQAKSEGEAQCAIMCKNKDVYSSASQDADSLLFGSPRLIRNLNITGKRKIRGREIRILPEIIELDEALSRLEITREQLIIVGILVGTDYNLGGVKGFGPKKALAIVKKHKTLENVLKHVEWSFDIDPKEIYEFFKNPSYNKYEIRFKHVDPERIKRILCDEHDFSEKRIDQVIEKLELPAQSSLSAWLR